MKHLRIAILTLVPLFVGCTQSSSPQLPPPYYGEFSGNVSTAYSQRDSSRKSKLDVYAPDFVWKTASGRFDSLSGQRGKVVLLNFWATWCAPCKTEMPDLEYLKGRYGDTLSVIGVSIDYPGDAFSLVGQFVKDNKYTYQFVVDSAYSLFTKYLMDPTTPIPQSFVIDTHGNVLYQISGVQSRQAFITYIERARS